MLFSCRLFIFPTGRSTGLTPIMGGGGLQDFSERRLLRRPSVKGTKSSGLLWKEPNPQAFCERNQILKPSVKGNESSGLLWKEPNPQASVKGTKSSALLWKEPNPQAFCERNQILSPSVKGTKSSGLLCKEPNPQASCERLKFLRPSVIEPHLRPSVKGADSNSDKSGLLWKKPN
jgi:hypothetical protein